MFFYYPEEDNVLGQHETSLNETNTEKIRDVTTNCFCFCQITNSLLTELVRSVQEDTAGLVLFSKKRKKNSIVQYPPVQPRTQGLFELAGVKRVRDCNIYISVPHNPCAVRAIRSRRLRPPCRTKLFKKKKTQVVYTAPSYLVQQENSHLYARTN